MPSIALSPAPMTALLELHSVRCVRGERLLFDRISATVGAGRVLRVAGANGSGKTSLLRMICGLTTPAAGDIRWRGQPVGAAQPGFHAGLVYIGHAPALKDELSALENLRAACAVGGLACSAETALAALHGAGLRGREHLPARALSQGQRKRAVLARLVVSTAPALWVLDEPFNALDDAARLWLQTSIGAQLRRGGVVVLTHHERSAWDEALPQVRLELRVPAAQPEMAA